MNLLYFKGCDVTNVPRDGAIVQKPTVTDEEEEFEL